MIGDFNEILFSNLIKVSNKTDQKGCMGFSYLGFGMIITKKNCKMYMHYTVHCTRAQAVKRQHRKRDTGKSEILTYKDTTQEATLEI